MTTKFSCNFTLSSVCVFFLYFFLSFFRSVLFVRQFFQRIFIENVQRCKKNCELQKYWIFFYYEEETHLLKGYFTNLRSVNQFDELFMEIIPQTSWLFYQFFFFFVAGFSTLWIWINYVNVCEFVLGMVNSYIILYSMIKFYALAHEFTETKQFKRVEWK